ncbi:BnaA06g39060D [Brassica napus]|uniref:Puromycin-sensitive aminopeptidase n=1 Tax=Brassica napus TaxID=3708 RepID=A0A078J9U5_BRANA|nr:BnaA06g39060D [Brassica napus]
MARLIIPCRSVTVARFNLLPLNTRIAPSPLPLRNSPKKRLAPFLTSQGTCLTKNQFPSHSVDRYKQSSRRLFCSVATESVPDKVEMDAPKEIFLKDYTKPDYYFETVDLSFSLGEEKTIVSSLIKVSPRVQGSSAPLVLDGHDLKLLSVKVEGKLLKEGDYQLDSRHLTLPSLPAKESFVLEIDTEIYPHKNTSLDGLYKSSGNFCTQCEAEGFRKITFYQDRPDIMAKYTCRVEADKSLYPVLLSNGNLISQGDIEGGRHFALWEDPFKKPCYLFALVAGQLASRDDTFTTRSGREVSLKIWTPAEDLPKTAHAMYSLKAAMKWDEDVFGLEYDLDLFNIVAVPDFNMGAMENKSLNIFNSKLVLASPETATDADYAAILGVIGHEYFHNWTGNSNIVTPSVSPFGGRHFALWEDPFKKPCYLFALVAGQLASRDDTFTTRSGREVSLKIWTPAEDLPKTAHAMYSLKAAMKWDEDVFGLEYDLDLFNIVAVPDFNMGAMENKSLNIFNSKLVLASPETATDADYAAILGVIGHEYFHNWTGNRVTCRDWFQLSLKEGLTVFRDQEFSSDMGSRTVKRIADVSKLRIYQFPQDAGPMAHPVRPHSYIKMDNFYTGNVFVYEKGAEVVRMYKTLLGSEGFRKGIDLYFQRHDEQAVTCEDFFAAMRDANSADFANFLQWYSQAGTPVVKVASSYNAEARTFSLKFSQEIPPTPGQPTKEATFIPVTISSSSTILRVTKKEEEFVFSDIAERPVPSLFRGFSAPVRVETDLSDDDLFFLLAHDSDEFNRWEAGQVLARKLMLNLVSDFQQNRPLVLNPKFIQGLGSVLSDSTLDKEFIAKAITLPGEGEIMDMMAVADPDAVHAVRKFVRKQLASELKTELLKIVENNRSTEAYVFDHPNMARRALKNTALAYLASLEDPSYVELALSEYKSATNLTDQFAALAALAQNPGKTRDNVLADFYNKWQGDYLVVNKWFLLQSSSDIPGNVENIHALQTTIIQVYSLIGGFCGSPVNFHAKDGSGYKFLGDIVVQLDKINPQVASRMVSAFSRWKRYDETRQALAKAQLEMIMSANGLSENVFEIASKSLAA